LLDVRRDVRLGLLLRWRLLMSDSGLVDVLRLLRVMLGLWLRMRLVRVRSVRYVKAADAEGVGSRITLVRALCDRSFKVGAVVH
jgi:hypothetical protein